MSSPTTAQVSAGRAVRGAKAEAQALKREAQVARPEAPAVRPEASLVKAVRRAPPVLEEREAAEALRP